MKKYFVLLLLIIPTLVFFSFPSFSKEKKVIFMVLESGIVKIETFPNKAPKTVSRVIELANSGFYDGLTFHRVIDGFMAQGGDPNGNGTGGSGKSIKAEFKIIHKINFNKRFENTINHNC